MSSETHGLNALSESALRDRYAANRARHDELAALRAEGTITVEQAQELRALATETNQIVALVAEFATTGETVAELPNVVVPPAPVAPTIETFDETQAAEMAEAVAAAATLSQNVAVSTRHDAAVAPVQQSLVASAASTHGGIAAGASVTLEDVGELVRSLAHDRGLNGESIALVTLQPAIAAAAGKVSGANSRIENTRIFNAAIMAEQGRGESEDGITAAPFDICGPADILRTVPECDNTQRYVPGWFRQIQSDHGQIEFYRSFSLADVITGVRTWDQDDQDDIDPADPLTWKPCVEIGCLPTNTIGVEAVTQCMTMPVFQMMTSPEAVASAIHAIRAATARVADGQLLGFYDGLASAYTHDAGGASTIGATIDVYDVLGRLLGMTAAANRQIDLSGYVLALEVGMLETLMLDNTMACNPRAAQEAAESLFGGLGIGRIEVTPDWSPAAGAGPYSPLLPIRAPGAAAIAVPPRPTTYRVRLFDPNDFAMLSPGGDSFGIIPDLANKRQNKVTWFGEIYQGLGKLGCKPAYTVQFTNLAATGLRAACITPGG